MPMKPFRPPLIRRLANPQQGQDTAPGQDRDGGALDAKKRSTRQLQGTAAATQVTDSPAKRRRVSQVGAENTCENPIDLEDSGYMTASSSEKQRNVKKTTVAPSEAEHKPVSRQVPFRGLSVTRKPSSTQQSRPGTAGKAHDAQSSDKGHDNDEVYFNVLWRKFTTKKHKTWDGDGILTASRGYVSLEDISGRHMGRIMFSEPLFPGSMLSIGGKDVEIDSELPREEYISGRAFLAGSNGGIKAPPPEPTKPKPVNQRFSAPMAGGHFKSLARLISKTNPQASQDANDDVPVSVTKRSSEATQSAYKNPLKNSTVMEPKNRHEPTPRHDPSAPGAVVMRRPAKIPKGRQVVDVVVDPLLSRHLRDHQKEGVKFMYECVMGMRPFEGEGCILADDMGLGKTLQTITLLWTLLKQNPIYEAGPVVKKALIVCPVTLISNWRKEFKKWLGMDRVGVFVADGTETRLTDFTMGKSYSVMIIGYERLRNVQEQLTKGPGIDIVIADEGHRLKTVQNKSAQAIQSLNTARRVILSGTPIQNDLTEFFAMVDFVNPGLLGTFKMFMKEFDGPIVRSRQPNACKKDIEKGKARSEELAELSSHFILRRTADLLQKYLPPKTEYVLFCNPTPTQASIYRLVLQSPMFQVALGSSESALQLITILKKLCNSPSLLSPNQEEQTSSLTALLESLPSGITRHLTNGASGKIRVLDQFLHNLHSTTDEKVVLVSNYTSTLNVLSILLSSLGLPYLRLDGSTQPSKRQGLVDRFNKSPSKSCFAFLLSAKAGGVGLNLIGASRLVLFDVDWNPATDLQAMARIHRDGQKRHCRIYRFLLKGGLEEKIWQRQVTKIGLADSVMDHKAGVATFSREELRDLFRLDETESCQTHDLLGCDCGGKGTRPAYAEEGAADEDDLSDSDSELMSGDDEVEEIPALTKASKVSESHINPPSKRSEKREKAKRQSLMQYAHFDPSLLSANEPDSPKEDHSGGETALDYRMDVQMEEQVGDSVLFSLLREDRCGVGYVFKKGGFSGF